MFDLGPEKIMVVLALVLILLGPKELPTVARTIGNTVRQLRSLQDNLRAELDAALTAEPEPLPPHAPSASTDPTVGDSFQ